MAELQSQAKMQIRSYVIEYEHRQGYELLPISDNIILRGVDIMTDASVGDYVREVTFSGSAVYDAFLYHTPSVRDQLSRHVATHLLSCLLYTSPSPRDGATSRMPSSA